MVDEKEIVGRGVLGQLAYLFLADDSVRWKGLLIVIAAGVIAGSLSDDPSGKAVIEMSVAMSITGVCLLAGYSITRERPSSHQTVNWLKPSVVAGVICSFAAVLGFLSYNYQKNFLAEEFSRAINSHDYNQVSSVIEQASTVSAHLHATLSQAFIRTLVREAAELPQKSGSLNPVLEAAKDAKARLDVPTVVAAGKEFAKASVSDPKAWEATAALLDYKTFLEKTNSPATGAKANRSGVAQYQFPSTIGSLWTINASNQPDVPQMHLIDQPDLNKGSPTGPAFLIVRGGVFPLDGYYLKRVIIQDAHVIYNGGALVLDQVYFVNCTFEIKQGASGLEFADAVFSNNPTAFTAA
jgi:hypothetical protein